MTRNSILTCSFSVNGLKSIGYVQLYPSPPPLSPNAIEEEELPPPPTFTTYYIAAFFAFLAFGAAFAVPLMSTVPRK